MFLLEKIFSKLRLRISLDTEKGKPSAGYLPSAVRKEALKLCKDICGGKKGNLLEIGCGEGIFLIELANLYPNLNIIGIDYSRDIINKLQIETERLGLNNIKLVCARAEELPFINRFLDTVICINTIYNLPPNNLSSIFKEILRTCKPWANFIFDIRNKFNPLLLLGYKMARYYDSSRPRYLVTYHFRKIADILNKLNFCILNKLPIGFPLETFAPAILILAQKSRPHTLK